MDKGLQELLGVEAPDDWMLPGTTPRDADRVIYVFLPEHADPSHEFKKVISIVNPPIPKNGAVSLDAWLVRTPAGEAFYPLSFHGDVDGFRQQIELGATELGLKMAKIEDGKFVVSDGPTFPLFDCAVTLDGSPFALPGR